MRKFQESNDIILELSIFCQCLSNILERERAIRHAYIYRSRERSEMLEEDNIYENWQILHW